MRGKSKGVFRNSAAAVLLLALVALVAASGQAAEPEGDPGPGAEAPVELIPNGSFEVLAGSWPQGFGRWTGQGQPVFAVDESIAHTGNRSIRITGDGASRGSLNRSVPVEGGRAYRLTVWYRADRNQLPSSTIVRVMAFKNEGNAESDKVPWSLDWIHDPSESEYALSGNNFHISPHRWEGEGDWRPIAVTFTLPDNVIRLDVQLFNWLGRGTVWYDDLSLVMLPPGTAKPQRAGTETGGETIDIQALLKMEHPRILATGADFARIQEMVKNDRQASLLYIAVKTRAEGILREPVSTYEIPDGLRLLATSRRVLDRVETLAMVYRIDGDPRYAERAWNELKAAGEFPDWNPRHFLDTAEMTRAFAIGYDWLYDAWTEEQREFLRTAIVSMGLEPALAAYRGTSPWGWWVRANHNWNFVVNGGIAMGALAIADEEPEIAEEILKGGLASLRHAIGRFAPDGGWDEGVGYWHYSVRYLIPYLAALESALGTEFGLADTPGIAETGAFPIYMTGPTNYSFNFADNGRGAVRAPELLWLARRFDRPEYVWWHQRRTPSGTGSVGDLLWRWETAGAEAFDSSRLPLDRHFRAVEAASFRGSWEDPNAVFLAFKAGDNRANHGNLDLGTFVLDALGVRWAEDLGADDYNLPGYFGGERWNYYRNRAEGQNTLVINPGRAPDQNPSAFGRIVYFESKPEEAVAIADLTPAYSGLVTTAQRGFAILDGRRQALVQDEVTAEKPIELWWFMHTTASVDIRGDGATAVLRQGDKRLLARILSPSGARFSVMPAMPLPTSPNPQGQNPNNGIQKLAIHLENVTDVRIAVQFVPLEGNEIAPFSPRVVPLEAWERAGAEVIWPAFPHMSLEIPSVTARREVRGDVPIDVKINGAEGVALEHVEVRFAGEVVYRGRALPQGLVVDTRAVPDGDHTLEVEVAVEGVGRATDEVQVRVANWWTLVDPFEPPIAAGFFGTIDRSKTSDVSPGWTYSTGRAEEYFGDPNRRALTADEAGYLVWDAAGMKSFEIVGFAPVPALGEALIVEVSADGTIWHQVAVETEAEPHPSLERFKLAVRGAVPEGVDARLLRVTLQPGAIDLRSVELGEVTLTGVW